MNYRKSEAAQKLGVDRRTITNWLRDGRITQTGDGRIPESEITRLTQHDGGLPAEWSRKGNLCLCKDHAGKQASVALRRRLLHLTSVDGRIELDRVGAKQWAQLLSHYASTGKLPTND